MWKPVLLVLTAIGLALQSYEPPALQNGTVEPVEIMTAAAGMVLADLTVSERGMVTNTRLIQDVAPFGDLTRKSIASWRFTPARLDRVATESHVLVIGLYRPPAILFPVPEVPRAPAPDDDDSIPFPTNLVVPPYPPNHIGSESVLVQADVDETGRVTAASALTPSTGFDGSAVSTAREWTFRPAMKDGKAVPSRIFMIVSFRQPI
jgi:TonB family protein